MSKSATTSPPSGGRHAKFKRMFSFLEERAYKGEAFTLEALAKATGYKLSSIRTYYGKRLKGTLVEEELGGRYRAVEVDRFDETSFIAYMTQRSSPDSLQKAQEPSTLQATGDLSWPVDEVVKESAAIQEQLLSQGAHLFHLALELHQRVSQPHRLFLFCTLALDAWEALMRAEVVGAVGAQSAVANKPRTRMQLMAEVFPNPRHPVCVNLTWLQKLCGEAPHLFVDRFEKDLWPLYQACALNFHKRWQAIAGREMPGGVGRWQLEMVSSSRHTDRSHGPLMMTQLSAWSQSLRQESVAMADSRFAIYVEQQRHEEPDERSYSTS